MIFASMDEILSGASGSFTLEVFSRRDVEEVVWRALDDSGKWQKRKRCLTAPLVLWTVVAMSVFRSLSIVNVFKRVLEAERGTKDVSLNGVVTPEALYHARARLGDEPLRRVALGILGLRRNPGDATFLGLRPRAIDGVTMDVPDTPANEIGFGRPVASRGSAAFPQLKAVFMLDVDTRQVADAIWGAWNMSELDAAEMLVENLTPQDVLFLDRRFTKVDLWFKCLDLGVHFVHRLSASYHPKLLKRIGPGDWLIDVGRWVEIPLEERSGRRKWRWESRTLRVIQYQVGELESVKLITDLLDPLEYPARDIAIGYHLRWEIEVAYDEMKTHLSTVLHGALHTTFRSKNPRGVIQEGWGMTTAYNLIRGLMVDAGEAHDVPPLEISFVESLEVIRMAMPRLQSCSDRQRPKLLRRMLQDIAECRMKRPRRKRWAPRVVKQKMSNFKLKRKEHRSIERDFAAELMMTG